MERNNDDMLYTQSQLFILQITGMASACLSVIGSSLIIRNILCCKEAERKKNLESMYKRLILGLSTLDIIVSLGANLLFGPFSSVPRGIHFVYAPQGNWTTCNISGFFIFFSAGTMFYSAFLSLYFALLIQCGIKEEKMKQCLEPCMHIFSVSFPAVAGIVAIIKGYINPMVTYPGVCWLYEYPPECTSPDNNIECERGADVEVFAMFTLTATVVITFLTNFICFALVIHKVMVTEFRSSRYTGKELRRTRATVVQALLYIGAFAISYTPLVVLQVVHIILDIPRTPNNRSLYFALTFIGKLLFPMQGVFCCFIFFFRRKKKGYHNKTSTKANNYNLSFQFSTGNDANGSAAMVSNRNLNNLSAAQAQEDGKQTIDNCDNKSIMTKSTPSEGDENELSR